MYQPCIKPVDDGKPLFAVNVASSGLGQNWADQNALAVRRGFWDFFRESDWLLWGLLLLAFLIAKRGNR